LAVKEQYEGAESREFWEGLGHKSRVADRSLYLSLAEKPMENRYDYTARLFHLTSWTGQFRADEVAPSSRLPQLPCPYPFVQVGIHQNVARLGLKINFVLKFKKLILLGGSVRSQSADAVHAGQ
jgi:hypothetical protein